MWNIHKLKEQKKNAINKFKKWKLCCGPLILAVL